MKGAEDGFLFVDKPEGPSSYAIVSSIRRAFRVKRVGHGGTLDPAASGLLIVALGYATRLLPYTPIEPKCYSFGIRFGLETDTLDAAGTVIATGGSVPTGTALLSVLPSFCGKAMQVPPEYSAVKVDGVRAYHAARSGLAPVMQPRLIEVRTLRLTGYDEPTGRAQLEVTCSGGTYVRSLARDIAHALGSCGHAYFIRRTALGPFAVADAVPFEKCNPAGTSLVPCEEVLQGMPRIVVGEGQRLRIIAGCNLSGGAAALSGSGESGPVLAVDRDNAIVAVLEPDAGGDFHPVRVFQKRENVSRSTRSHEAA